MANDPPNRPSRAKIAELFISSIPHARALGMEMQDVGEGKAEITMPYDEKLIGDPHTGTVHGGAVSALMDTCCGAAVISHPEARGSTATLDLRIDYFRGATAGQAIHCQAECYLMTRSAAFVRATAYDDNREKPVASAKGVFTVTPPKGNPT